MKYLLPFGLIWLMLEAGSALSRLIEPVILIPGSILGMLLLFALLLTGVVKIEWLSPVTSLFLKHMSFFFIPLGVGLLGALDLIAPIWVEMTLLLIVLWNAANYLISTISDGEGRVRDVIIGSAYSLFPYALFVLPIALLTNVLSLNEAFLYSFSMNIVWAWTGLMLFIMVKEIHNYSFWETVRNVLITIFTMALFVLTGYILYVLFNQLFDFVSAIFQEVRLRG